MKLTFRGIFWLTYALLLAAFITYLILL